VFLKDQEWDKNACFHHFYLNTSSTRSHNQSNYARKRNKRHPNQSGRDKVISICWWCTWSYM
jgi:hypothetical protein